jgi:hypothetical protein
MPLVREVMSVSQLCELLAIEPHRFIGVETDLRYGTVKIVMHGPERTPEDAHKMWKVTN